MDTGLSTVNARVPSVIFVISQRFDGDSIGVYMCR